LPRMKSDLLPLLQATIDGNLSKCAIEWDTRVAVTIVLASGGYPEKYETGKAISGLDDAAKLEDVQVFHAGTKRTNGEVRTAGGPPSLRRLALHPEPDVPAPGGATASPKPASASSSSARPRTKHVVNSLGPPDLQAVITLLKTNVAIPDAITDTELNRATVEG